MKKRFISCCRTASAARNSLADIYMYRNRKVRTICPDFFYIDPSDCAQSVKKERIGCMGIIEKQERFWIWLCSSQMGINHNNRFQSPHRNRILQRCSRVQAACGIWLRRVLCIPRCGKVRTQRQCLFAAFPRDNSERIPDTVGLSAFLPCMTRAGVAVPYP